jgi:ribosomal protein L28
MTASVSVSRDVAAPADVLWKMVSDLPRMGEWSPENTGGKWVKGATGPAVGARFSGTNARGKRKWSTNVVVCTCEPSTAFEFDVTAAGLKVARWGYRIEPTDSGCRVTETWTDSRGGLVKVLGKLVSGVADRAEHNKTSMQATLESLAASAEA